MQSCDIPPPITGGQDNIPFLYTQTGKCAFVYSIIPPGFRDDIVPLPGFCALHSPNRRGKMSEGQSHHFL